MQVLRDRGRQGAAISAAHPVEPERAAAPSESTPRPAHGPCTPAAGPRCRRLTGKQPPWMSTAQNQGSQQQVFLVTLSALLKEGGASAQPMLRDPSTMRREEVQACLLDAINNPIIQAPRAGGRPRSKKIEVEKMLIAQESHAARDAKHHHATVKITGKSTSSCTRTRCGNGTTWRVIGRRHTLCSGVRVDIWQMPRARSRWIALR